MTRRSAFRPPDVFLRRGMRTNPFCQITHAELAHVIEPESWVQELAEGDWSTLLLVGESGRGKTSAAHLLMHMLRETSGGVAYSRLDEQRPKLPRRGRAGLYVLDSVQWLRPRQRARALPRWLRGGRSILVGQEDVTRELEGVEVLRMTPPEPSVDEILDWYGRRVRRVCLAGRTGPALERDVAERIVAWCGGNRMRVHELMYTIFEALPEACERLTLEQVESAAQSVDEQSSST